MKFYRADCTTIGGELGLSMNNDTCNLSWYFEATSPELVREYAAHCPGVKAVVLVEEVLATDPNITFDGGRYVSKLI